jgi:SAM-dependent methyltransferase
MTRREVHVFHPQGPTFLELAQQALSSTERGYDLLAPKFEYTPFRTPDELLLPSAPFIGEPGSVEAALDLCCGTGAAMRMLRPLCRSHVTGIDVSRGMLEEAEQLLRGVPGEAEFRFVRRDVLEMTFDAEFEVATCFGALGHVLGPDQDRFVDGIRRALVPGGRLVFVTGDMPTPLNPTWWLARDFNFAMHVRNAVLDPPFIMFYLLFTLPRAREILLRHGFSIEVHDRVCPRFPPAKLVIATR